MKSRTGDSGMIDLYDNLVPEIERLDAMVELLTCARPEEFSPRVLPGVAAILGGIRSRMGSVLESAFKGRKPR